MKVSTENDNNFGYEKFTVTSSKYKNKMAKKKLQQFIEPCGYKNYIVITVVVENEIEISGSHLKKQ
jgi:hypothetical protein